MTIASHCHDQVAVIEIVHPPVNALSAGVRRALQAALDAAITDPGVSAIVLTGANGRFSAGADIRDMDDAALPPTLPDIVALIAASAKPIVAALDGFALGGGLELALGCHGRVATEEVKLGLPEIKLGLLPGAGGTQRLTRLIGLEAALPIILKGEPIQGDDALAIGLVDRLVEREALTTEAITLAMAMADDPLSALSVRRSRVFHANAAEYIDQYARAQTFKAGTSAAHAACLSAVRAAVTLPLEQGLQMERDLFNTLRNGAESRALRHIFLAERRASHIDSLAPDTPVRDIETVAVLGGGTMGLGIAIAFLSAGFPVVLIDPDPDAVQNAAAAIQAFTGRSVEKARFSPEDAQAFLERLEVSGDLADAGDRDLIVEAVFEDISLKRDIFRRLDGLAKPGAILATNTSYLDVNLMASATQRPQDVVGLHFFSPAHLMRLLEIVRGERTSLEVLATAMQIAKRLDKVGVVSGVCEGFIANRMMKVRRAQADQMLLEGASPAQIDQVLVDFGFPMGPFQMADLAGLDLGWHRQIGRSTTVRERLCELGRLGQKNGKGYYDYGPGRERRPSPEVDVVVEAFAQMAGVHRSTIDRDEILERLLQPMIAEGFKILNEGIAQRAADIDVAWVNGFGWPRETGGPMFWAAERTNAL